MYTALNSPDRAMDQQSTTISKFAGVGADLIYPLADAVSLLNGYDSARDVRAVLSPHGAFEDPTGTGRCAAARKHRAADNRVSFDA